MHAFSNGATVAGERRATEEAVPRGESGERGRRCFFPPHFLSLFRRNLIKSARHSAVPTHHLPYFWCYRVPAMRVFKMECALDKPLANHG